MFFLKSWYLNIFYKPLLNFCFGVCNLLEKTDIAKLSTPLLIISFLYAGLLLFVFLMIKRHSINSDISKQILEINKKYQGDPIIREAAIKKLSSKKDEVLKVLSIINLVLIFIFIFAIDRIFSMGINREDNGMLYSSIRYPKNTNVFFLDIYNLSESSFSLNLILALVIFIYEGIGIFFSKAKIERGTRQALFILPMAGLIFFSFLNSASTVFMIIVLLSLIIGSFIVDIQTKFANYGGKVPEEKEESEEQEE